MLTRSATAKRKADEIKHMTPAKTPRRCLSFSKDDTDEPDDQEYGPQNGLTFIWDGKSHLEASSSDNEFPCIPTETQAQLESARKQHRDHHGATGGKTMARRSEPSSNMNNNITLTKSC